MKVYGVPDEVAWAEPDYANYDLAKETLREQEHEAKLAAWLKANGYPGKHTGEIFATPRGDGYARYMFADGKTAALIHLPYGDAWDDPDVQYIPKKEILRRIEQRKRIARLFAAKEPAA